MGVAHKASMNIAIDISPLESGHKVRGVGFYLLHLKNALEKYFPEHTYQFFTNQTDIPGNADIVHFPYFDPFFQTLPLIKTKRTVVTVHDLTPILFPNHFPAGIRGKLQWQINKWLLRQVEAVITDSISSKKDIQNLLGITEKKISIAYLAAGEEFKRVKINKSQMVRKKYHLPEQFALYVGDVTWNKNVPRIIQAATIAKTHLVLVGKALAEKSYDRNNPWNKDKKEIEKLSANNPFVHILGFLPTEDVIELYNLATVFVMPSLYEGFGLPVLEAMSCYCPVICSDRGSLKEVVGNAALIVDPESIDIIAKTIQKVCKSTLLQEQLAKKGLAQTKQFNWKKTAHDTIDAYQKVLLV